MSTFRKLSHLEEQLGDERFQALISSDNTGKVKEFCDELIQSSIPTEMTVGGRTYDILGFLRGDEKLVVGPTMVERAREMNAHLGKDDSDHILVYQEEIPVALRNKVRFVFTDDRNPYYPEACEIYWESDWENDEDGYWNRRWGLIVPPRGWHGLYRVLRRK